jgi:hypothetical protein
VQPVFNAILESAVRLCGATVAGVYRFDGERLEQVAAHNSAPGRGVAEELFGRAPSRHTVAGLTVLDGRVVHIEDAREAGPAGARRFAELLNFRGILGVPMLREGRPIGAIVVGRREVGFPSKQIELLKNIRRPGGDRDRERPPVQGTGGKEPRPERDARAADGDGRDPAGDREFADRSAAGHGGRRGERRPGMRSDGFGDLPPGRGAPARGGDAWTAAPINGDRRRHSRQWRHQMPSSPNSPTAPTASGTPCVWRYRARSPRCLNTTWPRHRVSRLGR